MNAESKDAVVNHYEVLDCDHDATNAQIREAYQRAVRLIDGDNVAGYAMLDEEAQREARAEIEEAYALLADPAERARYDALLGGIAPPPDAPKKTKSGKVRFLRPVAQKPVESNPTTVDFKPAKQTFEPIELHEDETIDGERIKSLRESRDMTLEEIAKITRIRLKYLKAIEQEDLDNLPERVFVRGFLTQVGRVLKVDRARLADRYCEMIAKKQTPTYSDED